MRLLDLVGTSIDPVEVTWTEDDTILYALGVGAGSDPDLDELHLTVERSSVGRVQALPTLATALCLRVPSLVRSLPLGDHPVVHAAQDLRVRAPLPAAGRVQLRSTLTAVHDAGRGAVLVTTTTATAPDGAELFATDSHAYVIGAGGFGGEPAPPRVADDLAPDHEFDLPTRPEQALLYRLTGDRNLLHADPAAASRAGFDRPILHGLATLGAAVRRLLPELAGGDPARVRGVHGRFSGTVIPGDLLRVRASCEAGTVRFDVLGPTGKPVVKDGVVHLT